MVIGLYNFQGLWLQYIVSGSYYGSRPNRQIFQKFTTHVIEKVNTPNPFYEHVIQWRLISLQQTGVLRQVRVIDLYNFPNL